MNAIVAVDENWNIGKDGELLVHLSGDLKYFKEKTIGKTIVIGRKTLESFPGAKPLPGRENIVLTQNKDYHPDGCIVLHSKAELTEWIENTGRDTEDLFICGGETVYRQFLEDCGTIYVTKIFKSFDGDRKFPCLDGRSGMEIASQSSIQQEKGISYQFFIYKNKKGNE